MLRSRMLRAVLVGAALSAVALPAANAARPPTTVRSYYQNPDNPEHYVACIYLGPNVDGICIDPFAPWR